MKLEAEGLRLLTYYIHDIPGDPAACQKVFKFGRKMGIETFLSEPKLEALDTIEKFANEYGINVALHNHDQKASPAYWNPEGVLKACAGRSSRIGACGDIGYWLRSGIDPVAAAGKLGSRLITLQVHDLNETGANGHDVPWGTGVSRLESLMRELQQLNIRPTMIGLEYSHNFLDSLPDIERSVRFFDQLSETLAGKQ
jgi:sugar phosphate isomerase/epimerase